MVKVYLSEKFPDVFHTVYSGNVTSKDDESYWEEYLKPFLIIHRNITFVTEFTENCYIMDKSFFDSSQFDQLDPLHRVSEMSYIGFKGLQKTFIQTYISKFPCDYVKHTSYETINEYQEDNRINFDKFFKCVFEFESDEDN